MFFVLEYGFKKTLFTTAITSNYNNEALYYPVSGIQGSKLFDKLNGS